MSNSKEQFEGTSAWKIVLAVVILLGVGLLMAWPSPKHEHDAQGRVIVTYWEKWSGSEQDAARALVAAFNEKMDRLYKETGDKKYLIFVELITQGDIEQKVKIATSGGTPPDLCGLYSFNVNVYASQNALMPLDQWLAEAGIKEEDYIPSYWRLCRHDGKTWCLPTAPASLALFWNKKLFREAGLDPDRPPRTLKELDEYADKLTKHDANGKLTQIGFMPAEPGWWKYSWGWWFGGRLWDGKSKITCAEPENVKALEWVKSYFDKYGGPDGKALTQFKAGLGNFNSRDNGFFAGKVAMEIQGVWLPNFIKTNAPEGFEYGCAPFPSAEAGLDRAENAVTIAEADVIGIPNGARHPREAFEFIKFAASVEGIEILCKGQWKHSPLKKTSDGYFQGHPNPHAKLFTDLAYSSNAKCPPPIGMWNEYQRAMQILFDNIWNSKEVDIKAELQKIQEKMQQRLDYEMKWSEIRKKARGE